MALLSGLPPRGTLFEISLLLSNLVLIFHWGEELVWGRHRSGLKDMGGTAINVNDPSMNLPSESRSCISSIEISSHGAGVGNPSAREVQHVAGEEGSASATTGNVQSYRPGSRVDDQMWLSRERQGIL